MRYYIFLLIVLGSIFYLTDFRSVIYDSEPDYIANGLLIHQEYQPLGSHHPATINYYIVSFNLIFAKLFNLSISSTIIFLRLFYYCMLLAILYITKTNYIILNLFIIISELSFFKMFNFIVSAEVLLIPLSFLLVYLIINKRRLIYLSIVFGLMLNTKISSIIVLPLLIPLLRYSKYKLLKFSFLSFIFMLLLTLPSFQSVNTILVPFKNIMSQTLMILKKTEKILPFDIIFSEELKYFLVILFFFFCLIAYKTPKRYYSFFISLSFFRFLAIVYSVAIICLWDDILLRHFAPVLPIILLNIDQRILGRKLFKISVHLILLALIISKSNTLINSSTSNEIDTYVSKADNRLYLFQESELNSEIEFLKWAKYRYANSQNIIPEQWKSHNFNKVNYLNLRKYNDFKDGYMLSYDNPLIEQLEEIKISNSLILISSNQQKNFEEAFLKVKLKADHSFQLLKHSSGKGFVLFKVV